MAGLFNGYEVVGDAASSAGKLRGVTVLPQALYSDAGLFADI